MAEKSQKLTPKQHIAIGALLTSSTILEAAKTSKTAERTFYRWLKLDHFQAAYANARRQLVTQAMSRTQGAMAKAVDTLQNVMNDEDAPASARVSAARTVLDLGLKTVELEDLEERIKALEKITER